MKLKKQAERVNALIIGNELAAIYEVEQDAIFIKVLKGFDENECIEAIRFIDDSARRINKAAYLNIKF